MDDYRIPAGRLGEWLIDFTHSNLRPLFVNAPGSFDEERLPPTAVPEVSRDAGTSRRNP